MVSMWLILLAGGIFCIAGALFNWDWLMENKRSRSRYGIRLFSRDGARIFYFVIGLAIIVLGFLGMSGVLNLKS